MKQYRQFLPKPSAPAATNQSVSGTLLIATQRLNVNGFYSPASNSVRVNLPSDITPETLADSLHQTQLTEDSILVSEDGGTTWRRLTRAAPATGAFTLASYTTGTGELVSAANFSDGTQQPDYSSVSYSLLQGSSQTQRMYLLNDSGNTKTDPYFTIINPDTGEAQLALSGLFGISYLGTFAIEGDGTLTGTPGSVVWQNNDEVSTQVDLVVGNNEVAVFDITIDAPGSGSLSQIPWVMVINDTPQLVRIGDNPGWPAGTFFLSARRGTSLPLIQANGNDLQINRVLTHLRNGYVSPNPIALTEAQPNDSYRLLVTAQGAYQFQPQANAVPANSVSLCTFDWATPVISNLVYETGCAGSDAVELPTDQALQIGVPGYLHSSGNARQVTADAQASIGIFSRSLINGETLLTTQGLAIAIADGAITAGSELNASPNGVRVAATGERVDFIAQQDAADGEYLLVLVQIGTVQAGAGNSSPASLTVAAGATSVSNVNKINVSTGTLTNNGSGEVTVNTSGSGGSGSWVQADISGYNNTGINMGTYSLTDSVVRYFVQPGILRISAALEIATVNANIFAFDAFFADVAGSAGVSLAFDTWGAEGSANADPIPVFTSELTAYEASTGQGELTGVGGKLAHRYTSGGYTFTAAKTSGDANNERWSESTPFTWAAGDYISIIAELPIN